MSASKHENPSSPRGAFQPVFDLLIPHKEVLKLPPRGRSIVASLRNEVIFDRSTYLEKAPWWQTSRVFEKDFLLGNETFLFKDRKGLFGQTESAVKSRLPEPYFSLPYWSIVLSLTAISAWVGTDEVPIAAVYIPYWSIATPLTLLFAWLLLKKAASTETC